MIVGVELIIWTDEDQGKPTYTDLSGVDWRGLHNILAFMKRDEVDIPPGLRIQAENISTRIEGASRDGFQQPQ